MLFMPEKRCSGKDKGHHMVAFACEALYRAVTRKLPLLVGPELTGGAAFHTRSQQILCSRWYSRTRPDSRAVRLNVRRFSTTLTY
jgi:hypothetical protein